MWCTKIVQKLLVYSAETLLNALKREAKCEGFKYYKKEALTPNHITMNMKVLTVLSVEMDSQTKNMVSHMYKYMETKDIVKKQQFSCHYGSKEWCSQGQGGQLHGNVHRGWGRGRAKLQVPLLKSEID